MWPWRQKRDFDAPTHDFYVKLVILIPNTLYEYPQIDF